MSDQANLPSEGELLPAGPDASAVEAFRAVASRQPFIEALVTLRERYTYADLDRWSDAIAAEVIAADPPRDLPVAIVTSDNVRIVPAALGIVKAGRYFVTVDATDPDDRVALILGESRAAFCLVDAGPVAAPVRALASIPIRACPGQSVPPVEPQPPNEWVHVCFTSGTTGKPKAIRTRHRGFVASTLRAGQKSGRRPGGRVIYTSLPGYTRAANNLFNSLLAGSTMCAFDARSESLTALASYIQREKIDLLSLTPALFRRLMAAAPEDFDLSSVRRLRIAADKVTPADVEVFKARFPRTCTLECGYASTETGGRVFSFRVTHDTRIEGPLVPMGTRNPRLEVRLLDDEGNEVATGETGEIVVTGPDVVEGYWNDPELTAAKFRTHPNEPALRTFYTGDLARRDADGLYYFVGRKDSRLKIYGRRIDPSEVEAAILATGPVREAVVVGKPDRDGNLRLVAYVVMQPGQAFDARAIRTALRARVPGWMVPVRMHQLEAMPITRNGKVDRATLSAMEDPVQAHDDGAGDEFERTLAEIWSRVVGVPVRVNDDFFNDLGGESVVAAHLVAAVQRETGRAMPLSLLLELNTVSKMAAFLRSSESADRLAVRVKDGGPHPPLFCASGKGGSVMRFRNLAEGIGSAQPIYGLTFHGFTPGRFPTAASTAAACYAEAIRGVQPEGPYFLCGYSGGARITLDTARLLERQGHTVAFVAILDAAGTQQNPGLLRRVANRLDRLRQQPGARAREFVREAFTRPVRWARAKIVRYRADNEIGLPPEVRASNAAFRTMKKDYATTPLAAPVTLFRARNGWAFLGSDPDLGWRSLGVTRLEIVDIPGDHVSILIEDAKAAGEAIREKLEQARQRLRSNE